MDQLHEYEEEEEEDDVHICGLCRAQFSDVQEFINHKKGMCPVRLARKHKQQQSFRTTEASTNLDSSSNGLLHPQGSTDDLSRVDMMGKGDNSLTIQLNQEGETIGYLQFSNMRSDLNQASQAMEYSQDLYGQGDPNTTSHEYVLLPNSTTDDAYTKQTDITYYQTQPHTQMQPNYSHNILQAGHNTEYTQSFDCSMLNHHAMQHNGDGLELSDSIHSSIQTMPLAEDGKLLYNMNKEQLPGHGNQTGDPYNKPVSGLMRQLLTRDPKDPQGASGGGLGQEMPLQSLHHENMDTTEVGVDSQNVEYRAMKLQAAVESKHLKKAKQKGHIVKTLKEKNFVCEVKDCTYRTAYLKDLERHMRLHTGERPYKCDRCDKIFSRSDKLQVHLRYHLNERSFKCSLCPYSSVEKGTLNKHMMVHKDEKPFSCQLCTYKCRNRTQLSIHLRIHTGDQPYHCTMCDAVFKVSSDLKRHVRIHTGEKPYLCRFHGCDYKCAIRSNLKSHYRIHHKNEQEQLACKSCTFTTSSKKAYKEHVKGHSIVEDLVCKDCNYQCANKTSLRNHQKLHTKETFQCSFCSYAAKQKGNLLTHIERKHAKVVVNKSSKSKGKSKLLKELKAKLENSQQTEECVSPRKGNVKSKCAKYFECSQCQATFVREEALKCHVKQHKETSLSTAYAVLKLQQPVINDSSTQSPATVGSVVSDGVNMKLVQSSNREKKALTNKLTIEPLTFSTNKGFAQSSSTEALNMSSSDKGLSENLDMGVTVQSTNPMLSSPSALTYSIHGNVSHSQATLGINDILIAAGMSGVNSNSNSPTAGMKDIQLGSMAQSISGNIDISPSGKNFLLAQSPQDVPSVQVLQNISLPYIKLPNGQVLILTGQTNHTINSSNVVVDSSSLISDIQLQSFVQQPVYSTEQIIQCAADSTTSAPLSPSNQALVDNPDHLSSQQQGAIPIQIILPNDSQQTLPIVSQLLSSVLNRNVGEDCNQLQILQATSNGSGSQSMQSFVIQIPSQAGSMKDAAGNNVQESQSFVLQIPTSKFD